MWCAWFIYSIIYILIFFKTYLCLSKKLIIKKWQCLFHYKCNIVLKNCVFACCSNLVTHLTGLLWRVRFVALLTFITFISLVKKNCGRVWTTRNLTCLKIPKWIIASVILLCEEIVFRLETKQKKITLLSLKLVFMHRHWNNNIS